MGSEIKVNLSNFNECVANLNKISETLNNVTTISQSISKILSDSWDGKSGRNFIENNNNLSKDLKKLSTGVMDIAMDLKGIADTFEAADNYISSKISMK